MESRVYVGAGFFLLVSLLLAFSTYSGTHEGKPSQRDELPHHVSPSTYQITIEPHWSNFTFTGSEVVDLHIHHATHTIELHADQLEIKQVFLFYPSPLIPIVIQPDQVQLVPESKRLRLRFTEPLQTGPASLYIEFEGIISDQMDGLYRSPFQSEGEGKAPEDVYLISTQMEPVGARRVFPCWDEPARKATFQLTVRVPHDLVALSNTPVAATTRYSDALKQVEFEETPLMSTYLLAFTLGQMEYIEEEESVRGERGVTIRVYTTPGHRDEGVFALDVARKCLRFYEDYFQVNYVLPKMDLVAVPDFAAGAMENWGLITFREDALLVDPRSSSVSSRQRVAYVIAHEIAHQWFGNLVTMEWWKELWLNEGFATWIGNLAVDHIFPEWHIWLQFGADYLASAQRLDALPSTHPVEVDVSSGDQIMEIFDAISYCKGASIIRMAEAYVGADQFRQGMQAYIQQYQYKNARTADLWAALSNASSMPVTEFMHPWTATPGYPVVTVRMDEAKQSLTLMQERYYSSCNQLPSSQDTHWNIPLHIRYRQGVESIQLREPTMTLPVSGALKSSSWIYPNAKQAGFYRVLLDDETLRQSLRDHLEELDSAERLGLQNDWFALAFANRMPMAEPVLLAQQYGRQETHYAVWADLTANLDSLMQLWEGRDGATNLRDYVRNIFLEALDRIGWEPQEGDSDLQILLRMLLLRGAGSLGDQRVIDEAKRLFQAQCAGELVEADKEELVFTLAMSNGDEQTFEQMQALYRNTTSHAMKVRILQALARSPEEHLIRQALEFSISADVRAQDTFYAFASTSRSRLGRTVAWTFLQEHWERFVELFGEGQFLFPRIVDLATRFHTQEEAQQVADFFHAHPVPFARTLEQTQDAILSRAAWLSAQETEFGQFLHSLRT